MQKARGPEYWPYGILSINKGVHQGVSKLDVSIALLLIHLRTDPYPVTALHREGSQSDLSDKPNKCAGKSD